jgi:hypothetical protein
MVRVRAGQVIGVVAVAAPLLIAAAAHADTGGQCHVVDVSFLPTDQLQIAAWVEKSDGTYVDTIYLTQKVGLYGLGNRPGRFDFNSGPTSHDLWPYGRRTTVLPVWAHRRNVATGQSWPRVVFQNADENNLSHPFNDSSPEVTPPYCRPMLPNETSWDAGTCASQSFTDKGTFDPGGAIELYPPRADVMQHVGADSASVAMYKQLNPFDAITQPTPAAGSCAQIDWPIPSTLAPGDYVVWIEVNKAFDMNGTFNETTFPPPAGIPWSEYGKPYRGQPSIVYKVPFTIGTSESITGTPSYAGYGDPTGMTGTLNAPDPTKITEDTPGSGAQRFELMSGATDRVHVDVRPMADAIPPAAPSNLSNDGFSGLSANFSFDAPGDDGVSGSVTGYEIRVRASEMTPDNFADSMPVSSVVTPGNTSSDCGGAGGFPPAGTHQQFTIDSLLPETDYWVGVRAFDKCHNYGPLAIMPFTTPARQAGYVDACFVATAAYGSRMANDVEMLRHFRDSLLKSSVLGELAVETYYTFGPPVAGVVGESDLLRSMARDFLAPIVARVRRLAF